MSTSCRRRRATVDGADVLVTPLARALFPRPCARRLWRSPRPSRTSASAPRARSARRFGRTRRRTRRALRRRRKPRALRPAGRTVLALLSDGRLAIASARRATEWEETVEDVADEDDELEYAKEASHLHHSVGGGDDDGACVKLEAVVVSPAGGTFPSSSGRTTFRVASPGLTRRRARRRRPPDDGSASLLTVRLSFAYPRDSRVARGSREPRWSCEVVSAVDLPAPANAVARAEARARRARSCRCRNTATRGLIGLAVRLGRHRRAGDPLLAAIPASWPSASLPHACVALAAAPRRRGARPDSLAGLDARGVLRCGSRVVARDVRSFAVHVGNIGATDEVFEEDDAALASARAYAETWRATMFRIEEREGRLYVGRLAAGRRRLVARRSADSAEWWILWTCSWIRMIQMIRMIGCRTRPRRTDVFRTTREPSRLETPSRRAPPAETRARRLPRRRLEPKKTKTDRFRTTACTSPCARRCVPRTPPRHRQSHASYRAGRARRRRTPRFCRRRAPDAARQSGASRHARS